MLSRTDTAAADDAVELSLPFPARIRLAGVDMTSGAGPSTLRLAAGYGLYLYLGLAGLAPFVASGATPDRSVPESVATAPAQTADPELHHRLTGIVVSSALHEAIFTANGETRAIHEGQQIDGWTLTAVAPNDVTLQAAGETLHLAPQGTPHGASESSQPAPPSTSRTHQVADALARQQREQAAAEATLTAQTAKMQMQAR
jgi:hypothetical protein